MVFLYGSFFYILQTYIVQPNMALSEEINIFAILHIELPLILKGEWDNFLKFVKLNKIFEGIHLENICTKFKVKPSILKVSKIGNN